MLPFFRRIKKFFATRYFAARNRRYKLVHRTKFILRKDFIEGCISVVRLNLRNYS